MTINWFPGHMNKARREIKAVMPKVKLIIEVLDARIPFSSENPLVPELRGDTPCIKILNKSDLADPAITDAWLAYFQALEGVTALALHRDAPDGAKVLMKQVQHMLPPNPSKGRPSLVMILGIPNSGKSTWINLLSGRSIAKTSNRPAVTQMQQRIRIANNVVLLDTPGFLWPKLSPPSCGYRLAVTGAVKDAVIDFDDIAFFAAKHLIENYPDRLAQRYDLETVPAEVMELMEAIAARRGCMGRKGMVNLNQVCELLIRELRQGALGPISLETPADVTDEDGVSA